MNKTDISNSNFYIMKLINVLSTHLTNQKTIYMNGRPSDALVFITTGSCTYTFINDGYSITTKEGSILYLARNAVYTMNIHTEKYQAIYCDFEFDINETRTSNVYVTRNQSETENLFKKLYRSYSYPEKNSFYQCMSYLYQICQIVEDLKNEEYTAPLLKEKMTNAKQYIDLHFNDTSLSVGEICRKFCMSEAYFRKCFKSIYHISPAKYIVTVRIEKAIQLMSYSFISLEECACKCGFSSLQYFCKVFKDVTGTTPARYRKEKL